MPIKTNGYSNKKRLAKKKARQFAADDRQNVYDGLSKVDKIKLAKSRRGKSKRELARLE